MNLCASPALFDSLSSAAIRLDHTPKPFPAGNEREAIRFPRPSIMPGNPIENRQPEDASSARPILEHFRVAFPTPRPTPVGRDRIREANG